MTVPDTLLAPVEPVKLPPSNVVSLSRVELTVKALALVPVPAALVMLMAPVVAPLGTVVLTWLSETTVKLAAVPLKPTAVAPLNPLPVSVTEVPTGPLVGANEPITGAEMTVKALPLTPVPAPFVALMVPVVAPLGTVVSIRLSEATVKLAAVPLKATAVVPVKLLPVRVTAVPTAPLVGAKEAIAGGAEPAVVTVKLLVLVPVPAAVVTLMVPVVAPLGTVVSIRLSETTVKLAAAPLKATAVAPVNALPVNVTRTQSLSGNARETMAPEVAPAGTVVVIRVSETTVKVAAVPWKATAVVPVKLLPDSVTLVSGVPLVGEKELTTGAKLKLR